MTTIKSLGWSTAVFAGYLLASIGSASAMPCTPGGDLDSFWPPCAATTTDSSSSSSNTRPATQTPVKVYFAPSRRAPQAQQMKGVPILTPILRVQQPRPTHEPVPVMRKRTGLSR